MTSRPEGLYVSGGRLESTFLDSFEFYDPSTDSWSAMPPLLAPRAGHGSALAPDGSIYVVGGFDGTSDLDRLELFDPVSGTWSAAKSMPTPRRALTAVIADHRLYAIGGFAGGRTLDTVEVYDLVDRSWSTGSPLPTARRGLAAEAVLARAAIAPTARAETLDLGAFARLARAFA